MEFINNRQSIRLASGKLVAVLASALFAFTAQATPLLDVSSALTASDPTQLGRISRDGVPSDWSTAKAFPGAINGAISYGYHTYSVNVGSASFIEIMFDSISANTFASAYLGAYTPDGTALNFGLDQNYLGDAGTSGNFFGTDPLFFQVVVPVFSDLIIVINDTSAAALGLGQAFHLLVDGYVDSEYTNVPEPTTISLFLLALLAVGFAHRKSLRGLVQFARPVASVTG